MYYNALKSSNGIYRGGGVQGAYQIKVDQKVTNFKTGDALSQQKLEILKRVPFALGSSAKGLHTYMVISGYVYEVHYSEDYKSYKLFDRKPIEEFVWDGGLLTAPPDSWNQAKKSYCQENPTKQVCA